MGHTEGMQLVSERAGGRISSQLVESMSMQKKVAQEQELSGKKRCFACNETSHNLKECRIKYKLVTVAHQFGYATKIPLIMIQPSEEIVEKEKFYHHCLLITANVSNLDLGTLKSELQKLWNMSDGWVLRRECSTSFLASFSSEDDVVSCLNSTNMEILLDDKEVQLTVARWMEEDEGSSNHLIEHWFSVRGIPKIYRNWKELYQVASPFGVLIEVDEKSLEVGGKEPIRLKIALTSLDGAPFSYHYVVGWSTRMVMLTVEAKIDSENSSQNTRIATATGNRVLDFEDCSNKEHEKELNAAGSIVLEEATSFQESRLDGNAKEDEINVPAATVNSSNKTTTESSKLEKTTTTGEGHFKVITKPPVQIVYKRRPKKQQVTKATSTSPSNILDKGMGQERSHATRIGTSEMERERELNMEEIAPMGVSKNCEEHVVCKEKEDNSVTSAATKSKQRQTSEDTSKTERAQLVTTHTKGVHMDHMGPGGLQFHEKQHASKMDTRLPQNSEDNGTYDSFNDMGLHENLLKGIHQYGLEKPSVVHQRGIDPLCKGLNVIHQSLSGTTVTLCCGVLQQLDYASAECQALILVPTQDLAEETKKVIEALGRFLGVKSHICTGGTSAHPEQQTLSSKVPVIVGTPACVLDMLQRHSLCPDHIRMLILNEADELLTTGSKDQIYDIIQNLPTKIQVGLFSADFSNEALDSSRRFMDKPVTVIVPKNEELKDIKQFYLRVEKEEHKLGKLHTLLKTLNVRNVIIFVNTKDKVISLTKDIGKHYTVSASHDDMHQHARGTAIQKFKSGSSSIHITTGLRGTNNVLQVPIVINYDLPTQLMQYIRRVQQKNGQPGRERVVIDLVTPADERIFSDIKSSCYTKVRELPSDV